MKNASSDINTIKIETAPYNERRYGKPYIGHVTFPAGCTQKGAVRWGEWVGRPGDAGVLLIQGVKPGDIIIQGQRDNRNMRNSTPDYHVLQPDGTLVLTDIKERYLASKGTQDELNCTNTTAVTKADVVMDQIITDAAHEQRVDVKVFAADFIKFAEGPDPMIGDIHWSRLVDSARAILVS